MNEHTLPQEICSRLVAHPRIQPHIESVIWFGSIRNNQDIHKASDYDIQVIFDAPDYELTLLINSILKDYPEVDLSIMYLQDIFDDDKNVIFHDGTKSFFFMYVLTAGEILYGRNVYADILRSLHLDDSKPSLLVTAREYISRLRVMAAQSPNNTQKFKKYSLKLFKDVLLYKGIIRLEDITSITNESAYNKILQLHAFSTESIAAFKQITDYEKHYNKTQLAALLQDYEVIIKEISNE